MLRAEPVLAVAETVTEPLPVPLAVLSATQVAAASLAVLQAQPEGAVTLTVFEPPDAENESDVVETE